MSEPCDCGRAELLLAERLDGSLSDSQQVALDAHLAGCAACRELAQALAFVVETLRAAPEVAPAADLAERAASRALARVPRARTLLRPAWASPAPLPIAAALAMALMGAALMLGSGAGSTTFEASRLAEKTVNAREYLLERGDRLIEDLRLLRLVVSTAFEARVERVNDRVEDYRRLLERRRERQPGNQLSWRRSTLSARGARGFPNPARVRCVEGGGAHAPYAATRLRAGAASPEGA